MFLQDYNIFTINKVYFYNNYIPLRLLVMDETCHYQVIIFIMQSLNAKKLFFQKCLHLEKKYLSGSSYDF